MVLGKLPSRPFIYLSGLQPPPAVIKLEEAALFRGSFLNARSGLKKADESLAVQKQANRFGNSTALILSSQGNATLEPAQTPDALASSKNRTQEIKHARSSGQNNKTQTLGTIDEFLFRTEQKAVPENTMPAVTEFYKGARELIESIRHEDDGAAIIHFVLVDSMEINACFVELQNGDKVVAVNLGLLRFVQSDDELAFVIGHELEHGSSQLDAYIEKEKKREEYNADSLILWGLKRVVETEVDVKSVLRRVLENGHNPHAALHFHNRLIDRFGSFLSASHTSLSSRKDAVNVALTMADRVFDKKIPEDISENYSHELTRGLQEDFVQAPWFKDHQVKRARNFLRDLGVTLSIGDILKRALAGEKTGHGNSLLNWLYKSSFNKARRQLHAFLSGLISEVDFIAFELELHYCLDSHFEKTVEELGGQDLSRLNTQELLLLRDCYIRNYLLYRSLNSHISGRLDGEFLLDAYVKRSTAKTQFERAVTDYQNHKEELFRPFDAEEAKELRSQVYELERAYEEKKLEYDLMAASFPADIEYLLKRLHQKDMDRRAIQQKKDSERLSNFERERLNRDLERENENYKRILNLINETQFVFPDLRRRNKARLNHIDNLIVRGIVEKKEEIEFNDLIHFLSRWSSDDADELKENASEVLETVFLSLSKALNDPEKRDWVISYHISEFKYLKDSWRILFSAAFQNDPVRLVSLIQSFLIDFLEAAPNLSMMANVFKGIGFDGRFHEFEEAFVFETDRFEGFRFSQEFATLVFTPEFLLKVMNIFFAAKLENEKERSSDPTKFFMDHVGRLRVLREFYTTLEVYGFLHDSYELKEKIRKIKNRFFYEVIQNARAELFSDDQGTVLSDEEIAGLIFANTPHLRAFYDPENRYADEVLLKVFQDFSEDKVKQKLVGQRINLLCLETSF
ncbi:MAG: M48 family metalloprotease [Deltaproteobacteria bacterium]|nr:M48 family metalloprotease [Deltaproteobacteria bacterium]